MMFNDDNFNLYAFVLLISGAVLGASFFAQQPTVQVAGIMIDEEIDTAEIETASIGGVRPPEGSVEWNFPEIPWRSYEDGVREMAQTGKPGLLVLQADWCLVCDDYQSLFQQANVLRHSEDYVFILADIEDQPDLQQRYNVDGDYIPRTFVLSPEGDLLLNSTGPRVDQRFFVDPYNARALGMMLERGSAQSGAPAAAAPEAAASETAADIAPGRNDEDPR